MDHHLFNGRKNYIMKNLKTALLAIVILSMTQMLSAKNPEKESKPAGNNTFLDLREDCQPATESVDL